MRPFILFLYGTAIGLVSFIGNSDALSVCTRPNQSMSDGFFQRVDLPSAIACIERCIEYMEICHSALFIRFDEKLNGICQLYPINSEDSEEAFQEQDNPDAESTVFELLDRCPPITKMDMMRRLSEEALNRLAEPKKTARALTKTFDDEIIQREEIYPKRDSFTSSELAQYVKRDRSDRGYATMHSVDEPPNHRNPWQNPFESLTSAYSSKERPSYLTGYSSSSNEKDSPSYGPSPSLAGLSPIQPIQVLHRGQPMLHRPAIPPPLPTSFQSSYQQSSCQPGAPCVPTLHQLDKSPCPAKQGDPCAPKPPCSSDKYPEISCQLDPEWSEWTACSVTCGIGQRMRTCSEGKNCPGISMAPCFMPVCQFWGPWGQWTSCSATCGSAQRSRRRQCIGGNDCIGGNLENQDCGLSPCPEWSEWGSWEGCNQSCGRGLEKRFRRCEGGLSCPGMPVEERICDRGLCPYWGSWSRWSQCSTSCGGGVTIRTRECINGPGCDGEMENKQHCNTEQCPIWSEWTDWTLCPKRCGEEAARIRNRACYYKGVMFSGCEGPAQDQSPCPVTQCPKWREWGDWSECSQTCGQGTQIRTRTCDGNGCEGPTKEMRFCQISVCPYWGEWGQWSGCSVTCGLGVCEKRRKCIVDDLVNLPSLDELEAAAAAESGEDSSEKGRLSRNTTPSPYLINGRSSRTSEEIFSSWSRKKRSFSRESAESVGCDGVDVERKTCDAGPCCYWDEWTDWSPCIGCGVSSISRRSRACNGGSMAHAQFQEDPLKSPYQLPSPSPYQLPSPSPYKSSPFGDLQPIIPVNFRGKRGAISQYLPGSECQCDGPAIDTRTCPSPPTCESTAEFSHDVYPTLKQIDPPPVCEWTEWGKWCGCENCRAGRENRRRFCDLPARRPGGPTRPDPNCHCSGTDIEERTCIVSEKCLAGISDVGAYPERPVRPSFPRAEETTSSVEFHQDQRPKHQRIGLAGSGFNEQKPVDYAGPIYSSVEISSIQKGPWNGKEDDGNSTTLGKAILVQDFKKDSLFSEDQTGNLIGDLCRWSKWSDWSECEASRLKQRNRFCIGANSRSSNVCQCMGLSVEETSCVPSLATSVEFIALSNQRPQKEKALITSRNEENEENEVNGAEEEALIIGKKCKWTRWSQWSPCTATCGTAERLRRRRCECENESLCGSGITTETEGCEMPPCEENDLITSRPFPKFSIFW